MAVEHKYTIVPLSNVGFEDMLKAVVSIPGSLIFGMIGDKRGTEKTEKRYLDGSPNTDVHIPLHYPSLDFQYNYVSFGKPIYTDGVNVCDEKSLSQIQRSVKASLENEIVYCRKQQTNDPERYRLFAHIFGYGSMGKGNSPRDRRDSGKEVTSKIE
jgi:hypothetical protein